MTIPNPLRDDEVDAWDTALLASIPSPGLIVVAGATSPRKWEESAGPGTTGATLRWTADGLPEFDAKITITEPEQFDEWEAGWGKLTRKTPPGQKPKAFDFRHPATDDLEIRSVVVLDLTQWEPDGDDGAWSRTVKFKQYRAPAPIAAGVPLKPDAGKAPEPQDEQDKQIAALITAVEKEAAK